MIRRIRDWLHEAYIGRLHTRCQRAYESRDRVKARLYWVLMVRAIQGRSEAQVRRMERQAGLC